MFKTIIITITLSAFLAAPAAAQSRDRAKETSLKILKVAEKIAVIVKMDEALTEGELTPDERAEAIAFTLIVYSRGYLEKGKTMPNPNDTLDEAAKLVQAAKAGGTK